MADITSLLNPEYSNHDDQYVTTHLLDLSSLQPRDPVAAGMPATTAASVESPKTPKNATKKPRTRYKYSELQQTDVEEFLSVPSNVDSLLPHSSRPRINEPARRMTDQHRHPMNWSARKQDIHGVTFTRIARDRWECSKCQCGMTTRNRTNHATLGNVSTQVIYQLRINV